MPAFPAAVVSSVPDTALASALSAMSPSQQQSHVEQLVLRVVQDLTDRDGVSAETPLMEAGVDSLAATELASRLRTASEVALSSTIVFEQPTPRAIAAHSST